MIRIGARRATEASKSLKVQTLDLSLSISASARIQDLAILNDSACTYQES